MYGGSPQWIANLVKHTKKKCDISKNNILIIKDRTDKNDKNKRKFFPKKD
jgi:hypothetical protein